MDTAYQPSARPVTVRKLLFPRRRRTALFSSGSAIRATPARRGAAGADNLLHVLTAVKPKDPGEAPPGGQGGSGLGLGIGEQPLQLAVGGRRGVLGCGQGPGRRPLERLPPPRRAGRQGDRQSKAAAGLVSLVSPFQRPQAASFSFFKQAYGLRARRRHLAQREPKAAHIHPHEIHGRFSPGWG